MATSPGPFVGESLRRRVPMSASPCICESLRWFGRPLDLRSSASPGDGETLRWQVPAATSPFVGESRRWRVPSSASPGGVEFRRLPRSCSAYSRRLQVCVEYLTRPESEEDLLVLTLLFTAPVGLGRHRLPSRGRREPAPRLACTPQHEFSPVQGRRMCLIARASTPTTKKTPWPRGGPRCHLGLDPYEYNRYL